MHTYKTHPVIYLLTALLVGTPAAAQSQSDTPPVRELKQLIEADEEFRATLNRALANVKDVPGGIANPWRNKRAEDLFAFLNEWYYFLPNAENGLKYIEQFALLYYKNPDGLRFVREEPGLSWTRSFSEARGAYMDSGATAHHAAEWMAQPSTKIEEFIVPEEGFRSFNEFFTRAIKPGARPVDGVTDDAVVVSPADCLVNMINNDLAADSQIPLKGRMSLNVAQLLDDSRYADRFIGGTALACFLLPESYHHYHAPVSGNIVESKSNVGHLYFGMDDLPGMVNRGNAGYNQDFSVFEDFKHGYFIFDTPAHGHVAMIPVGLNTVGSVVFEDYVDGVTADAPKQIQKGERLGHFAYGGSLVILLFGADRFDAVKTLQGQQIGLMN